MLWRISLKVWVVTVLLGTVSEWFILQLIRPQASGGLGEIFILMLGAGILFSLPAIPLTNFSLKRMLEQRISDWERARYVVRNCLIITIAVFMLAVFIVPGLISELRQFYLYAGYAVGGAVSTLYFGRKLIFRNKYSTATAEKNEAS